jgi:hypothetical protein
MTGVAQTLTYDLIEALDRILILKVLGVGDLAGCPWSFVGRVVNERRLPLALVVGVLLARTKDDISIRRDE